MSTKLQVLEKCPHCGNEHFVKVGFNITVQKGRRQRIRCDNGHCFIVGVDYDHKTKNTNKN